MSKSLVAVKRQQGIDRHCVPHGEKTQRTGGEAQLPNRCAVCVPFGSLSHLCHEVAHGLCRLVLLLPQGVGVGPLRESCVVVVQHGGDGLDVYAVFSSYFDQAQNQGTCVEVKISLTGVLPVDEGELAVVLADAWENGAVCQFDLPVGRFRLQLVL